MFPQPGTLGGEWQPPGTIHEHVLPMRSNCGRFLVTGAAQPVGSARSMVVNLQQQSRG
jgi:hypothetical protein